MHYKDEYITVLADDAFTDTFADKKDDMIAAIYEESTAIVLNYLFCTVTIYIKSESTEINVCCQ